MSNFQSLNGASDTATKEEFQNLCNDKEDGYQSAIFPRELKLSRSSTAEKLDDEARVLVVYTGGTIGMIRSQHGVYAPHPKVMESKLKTFPQLHDQDYAGKYCNSPEKYGLLTLPETGELKRVLYTIHEYHPLLDSSNMTMDDWIRIALDIKRSYAAYDGFVVLHGTDTMAYTASALSFMLENLGKTVIITGSQIPLFEPRSDGRENFLNSLIIAGNYCIPEVTVLFNNKLFRGNRTSKVSTSSLDAFNTPNLAPLAKIDIGIQVDWKNVFRSSNIEKFHVHTELNRNVGLLRLFPSITVEVVRAFLSPPIEGVVLQTYGAGNGPTKRRDLMEELKRASRRGVIIVNCTQCSLGQVNPSYETGSALQEIGIVCGSDMTPEAALTKLSYVLSKTEWSVQTKRMMMQTNLRGELTFNKDMKLEDLDLITAVVKTLRLSSSEEVDALRDALYPAILCSIVAEGNLEKLEIMRQFGAYLSACDYDYRTPLHIAASAGNEKTVEYLLRHGASVHMRDRDHRTPLMNAVDNDHHSIIQLLIKAGSSLNLPANTIGEMLCSAARQDNVQRLESLFLAGASLSESDASNHTALHVGVELDHEETVKYLLNHNADVTCKDIFGQTPHDVAVRLEKEQILKLLNEYPKKTTEEPLGEK